MNNRGPIDIAATTLAAASRVNNCVDEDIELNLQFRDPDLGTEGAITCA